MGNNVKKIGIITFHNSYNCGSMLQAYALQTYLEKLGAECEVIDFSNKGQQMLYSVFQPNTSVKNIIKNWILYPHKARIRRNYDSYEKFKRAHFHLTEKRYETAEQMSDDDFDIVVAGSDQVWNITIEDGDDAYFLPWVKNAAKVAYAPSFGSKSLQKYASDTEKYKRYLQDFRMLSIREENGKKWLRELLGIDVPVLLDPTLLLQAEDYNAIAARSLKLPSSYIFYYSPGYSIDINKLVRRISRKYRLPVIAFNTKTFYVKGMQFSGFSLPELENPATYLQLIKNATVVITTSFHGTVFSTIYRKCFWTIKNGGMFGDDDRVKTLMGQLHINERLIVVNYDESRDYLELPDYGGYESALPKLQETATEYLKAALDLQRRFGEPDEK